MRPLPDNWIALLPADRERLKAELARYRDMGLADSHPLPARAIRRIAVIDRLLAAINNNEEGCPHDG